MPDFLALEFESQKVLGVDAQVSPSGVRIRKCFELEIPEALDRANNPDEAGQWLKEQLADLGIQGTQVVTTFPREIAVVRHIEMPDVPVEELPDLVKFQAGLKSAIPMDELALDFLPLPKSADATVRDVLIATVPRQELHEINAVAAGADLQVITAGLSPVSAAEIVLRTASPAAADSSEASLIVTRHGPRVEITLLKGPHVVFSHFTQVAGEGEAADNQAVVAAVSRSLIGLTGPVRSEDITQAWLLGSTEEFAALVPVLENRLNSRVQILDPFETPGIKIRTELPDNRSAYAALVGSLLAQSESLAVPVDFLAPRKPPVKPDHTRRRVILGTSLAACLALAIGGTMYFKINNLNKQISDLKSEQQRITGLVEGGRTILEKTALVEAWTADRTLWLDELVALGKHLPAADRAFLNQVQFDLGTASSSPRITLKGYSRERGDAVELSNRMMKQDLRYDLSDYNSQADKKDPYHPWVFDVDLLLKDDAPDVKLTAVKPEPKKQSDPVKKEKANDGEPATPPADKKTEGKSS